MTVPKGALAAGSGVGAEGVGVRVGGGMDGVEVTVVLADGVQSSRYCCSWLSQTDGEETSDPLEDGGAPSETSSFNKTSPGPTPCGDGGLVDGCGVGTDGGGGAL